MRYLLFGNSRGINLCRIFRCGQICRIRKKWIDDSDRSGTNSSIFTPLLFSGKNHNQAINSKSLEPLHNSVHYRTYTPLEGSFRKPQNPNLGVALLVIRLTFLVRTSLELLPFHQNPSKFLFPRLEIRFPKTHYIYMGCYNLNKCMCVCWSLSNGWCGCTGFPNLQPQLGQAENKTWSFYGHIYLVGQR